MSILKATLPITRDNWRYASRWLCYFYLGALIVYYFISVPITVIDFYVGKPYSNWEWVNFVLICIYTPIITLWAYDHTYKVFKWCAIYEVLDIRRRFGHSYSTPVPEIPKDDNMIWGLY